MNDERGENEIISTTSGYSFAESTDRIMTALKEKCITVFAVIDQSTEAKKVALTLRPTQLIIFGDPKAGTPLMMPTLL